MKPEKNNTKKNKFIDKIKNLSKDNKHILIAICVILVCSIGGFAVWKMHYHGESPSYIATQKQINKVNDARTKEFNEIHQDSFPTVQEANQYLVQKFGHKDLTSSAISYKEINAALQIKYGKLATKALNNGLCLSENMTPNQEINQEVGLAALDPNQKDYVGFMENRNTTNIYTPDKINKQSNYSVINSVALAPNNKLTWQNDNGYYLSSPVILPAAINNTSSKKYDTLLMFVQVPISDKDTSVKAFRKEISSIKVKVNDYNLSLSGSHEETNTGENQIGMQMCSTSGAANRLNIWNAKNIKAGSIVPVTFDFPTKIIKDANKFQDINISINGDVMPSLQTYNGPVKIYF